MQFVTFYGASVPVRYFALSSSEDGCWSCVGCPALCSGGEMVDGMSWSSSRRLSRVMTVVSLEYLLACCRAQHKIAVSAGCGFFRGQGARRGGEGNRRRPSLTAPSPLLTTSPSAFMACGCLCAACSAARASGLLRALRSSVSIPVDSPRISTCSATKDDRAAQNCSRFYKWAVGSHRSSSRCTHLWMGGQQPLLRGLANRLKLLARILN